MNGARVAINRTALKKIGVAASQRATTRAAEVTARRVRSLITSTGRVDTGAMRRSIRVLDLGPYTKRVTSTLYYTDFQNDGTRPHIIRPRRSGGLLVFYWPKVGRVVGFRQVHHPGFAGAEFYETALARLTVTDFLE